MNCVMIENSNTICVFTECANVERFGEVDPQRKNGATGETGTYVIS